MNINIFEAISFDWDQGNINKNLLKHKVATLECEQVFFNEPLLLLEDIKHSGYEKRYCALGKTDYGRKLFLAFTIRKKSIRIISARDMHKKERAIYEKA